MVLMFLFGQFFLDIFNMALLVENSLSPLSALNCKLFNPFRYSFNFLEGSVLFYLVSFLIEYSGNDIIFLVRNVTGYTIFLAGCGSFRNLKWVCSNKTCFSCFIVVNPFWDIEVFTLVRLVSLVSNKNKRCTTKFYLLITGIATLPHDFQFWILFEEIHQRHWNGKSNPPKFEKLYVLLFWLSNVDIGQDID